MNNPFAITIATGGGAGSVMGPGLAAALGPDFSISVVVPTSDSGSKTGEICRVFGGPAVGDARRVLAAVSGNEAGELFDLRFGAEADLDTVRALNGRMLGVLATSGADLDRAAAIFDTTVDLSRQLPDGLRAHTYGNLVLTALRLDYGEQIVPAVLEAGRWLDARAVVIPVTAEPHMLNMWDGEQRVVGEGMIDNHRVADPAQVRMWLENGEGRNPNITPEAYAAFARAGSVLIGPGSHFTSLLPIELPGGTARAIAEQRARGGMLGTVVNLVAEDHAMPQLSVVEHISMLEAPLGRSFDFAIYNTATAALPPGRVPLGHEAVSMSRVAAKAIGANLVDGRAVEYDANDPIAHLRTPVRHSAASVVQALREHNLLPVIEHAEAVA